MGIHILNGGIATTPKPEAPVLEMVRYRILGKPYSSWRAIIAESGESDTVLLISLKRLHGIEIDKSADTFLYCTQDTNQMQALADQGVPNPTMYQLAMTSKAWGLTEQAAVERMEAILRNPAQEAE